MKRKKVIAGTFAALSIIFTLFFFTGDQGLATYLKTNKTVGNLDNQIKAARTTIDSLEDEIDRLQKDTTYMERIAREKYGMAKSNETLYKFIEEK